jgi:DNA gyrase/topoisomerase IV subunit A
MGIMGSEIEDLTKRLEETQRLLSRETEKREVAENALRETRDTFNT